MNQFEQLRARLRMIEANAQRPARWNIEQGGGVASLHLYGVVGGFWGDIVAGDVVREIRELDVATLNVYINSPGGDVFDGIAIRNAIRQSSAHVIVHVDGLAASAASFIACAADELVMGENAELMIHDAWTIVLGNADELRTEADNLDRISDNIAAMYAEKAGGTAASWREVMKAETWYSASEAVAAGLADRVENDTADTDADVAASFDLSMFAHAGRAAASAPLPVAAMASPRKEPRMNREQLAAALAAGTITQAQHDDGIRVLDALAAAPTVAYAPGAPGYTLATAGTPGDAIANEYAAGPRESNQPVARVTERPVTLMSIASDAASLVQARANIQEVVAGINNALSTVVPADDQGEAFLHTQRIGEIWQAIPEGRPHVDALGGPKPLTGAKIEGWKWVLPTPTLQPYEGNLAEVPTGEWETRKVEEDPNRWAFANKVDRIYTDLGTPDLIASLLTMLRRGHGPVSDNAVAADLIAGATPLAGTAPATLIGALTRAFLQLKKLGAAPTQFWMGEEAFTDFAELKVSDLPAWIANATGFVELDGRTSLSNVFDVDVDFQLAPQGFLALDRRAADVYETPYYQVEAMDVAHGGADIGVFTYGGTFINDARALVKSTITPA
ncbi:head maturation protease, ClpP-related [Microbacterium oxydans]|uniref:head maturation protease, ClpP-related n=1 Tax=Microbacterium oxydans TaxID=82380 RepID=UPI000733EE8B|nr:head maturation protease, ClpP-related [Microbacterium oxydans]